MKEDIEFLKKLQHTLQNQDTDVQASPRFWVLMDYRTVPTGDEYAESHEVYDRDADRAYAIDRLVDDITDDINAAIEEDETDPVEEYYMDYDAFYGIEQLLDQYGRALEGALNAKASISCKFTAWNWINAYGPALDTVSNSLDLIPVRKESYIVPNTMFITKAEAEEYIKRYGYNHSSNVHTYAMTALRSPSVNRLFNLLETFNWDAMLDNHDDSKES